MCGILIRLADVRQLAYSSVVVNSILQENELLQNSEICSRVTGALVSKYVFKDL